MNDFMWGFNSILCILGMSASLALYFLLHRLKKNPLAPKMANKKIADFLLFAFILYTETICTNSLSIMEFMKTFALCYGIYTSVALYAFFRKT